MKKISKILVCLLALALVFLFTGCGEKIVAKVNGEKITEEELNIKVEQIAALNGYDLEGANSDIVKNFLQEQMLQAMIMEKLVIQDAKERKLSLDKKVLKEEMKKFEESFQSEKEYQDFLAANKLTKKDMENIYKNMLIYNQLFEEVTKDITTPSTDPEQYYNEHPEEFDQPEMVQVRHILVEKEEEAKEIIALLDKGEDFKKLAIERSKDPSVEHNEGLMEYFPMGGYMVPEFEEASFALKEIGSYTKEPVKTDFGYHVIKLEGKQEPRRIPFEEIKNTLIERFLAEEKNTKFQEYEQELLDKAVVENFLAQENEEGNGEEQEQEVEHEGHNHEEHNHEEDSQQEETASVEEN